MTSYEKDQTVGFDEEPAVNVEEDRLQKNPLSCKLPHCAGLLNCCSAPTINTDNTDEISCTFVITAVRYQSNVTKSKAKYCPVDQHRSAFYLYECPN
jgi:hypothetical protein